MYFMDGPYYLGYSIIDVTKSNKLHFLHQNNEKFVINITKMSHLREIKVSPLYKSSFIIILPFTIDLN